MEAFIIQVLATITSTVLISLGKKFKNSIKKSDFNKSMILDFIAVSIPLTSTFMFCFNLGAFEFISVEEARFHLIITVLNIIISYLFIFIFIKKANKNIYKNICSNISKN